MVKVAIVILNWNGQKMLAKYLPNVVEYSRQDAEIWVADNCSSDQSMHLLETQFPHVKTIVLEQNFGFAEGYNRALKEIEADYYVLLNSDVEVSHHWLTPLIEFMDAHPQVAACQPKLLAEYDKVKRGEEPAQLFTAINVSHTKAYIVNVKSEECF